MTNFTHRFALSASALAASLLVVACGGGGASPPDSDPGSKGFAVDDYLSGATVLCDTNGNGRNDAGESSTTTDATGFFNFTSACSATLVITGGTNLDTRLPFTGMLRAPAGSSFVTPLTTLMSAGMTAAEINTALGLPSGTDVRTVDPARKVGGLLSNPALFRKTLAVQQLIQKTAETLANVAGAGASQVLPTIYSEVAASVAASLRANPLLVSGSDMDEAAVARLVEAATIRVQTSSALSTEIKTGALAVNAASLAQVMAGAVVAQANAILQSADASSLTSITLAVQGDTTIADFALLNRTVLGGAPSTDTANLAATLLQQVPIGATAPPPQLTFSSGFAGGARTIEGGEFGGFSGSNIDNFSCGAPAECGAFAGLSPDLAAADSYFGYYYQTPTPTPASALYAGIYLQAPGVTGFSSMADTSGVQIDRQTTMSFNFNQNPEWYGSVTNNFMVQLITGRLYANGCHVRLRQVVTPSSVASVTYTLNLSSFVVVEACGVSGLTAAAALADSPISQVSFEAAGGGAAATDGTLTTGANLSVSAGSVYPTTLVVRGPITFQ